MTLIGGRSDACEQGRHDKCPGWTRINGVVYRCICSYGHVKALLANIYAREWGMPDRIGPGEYRWPAQEREPKS